jgi:hypothetical protein
MYDIRRLHHLQLQFLQNLLHHLLHLLLLNNQLHLDLVLVMHKFLML